MALILLNRIDKKLFTFHYVGPGGFDLNISLAYMHMYVYIYIWLIFA